MTTQNAHPANDEIEISLFGPGFGECIALHLGSRKWMIVDSCIDTRTGVQPAIEYLKSMGVDPAQDVNLVVATHWHADHTEGLAELFEECESAELVIPQAFHSKEFLDFLGAYAEHLMVEKPIIQPLYDVLRILKERRKRSGKQSARFAIADRQIWPNRDSNNQRCKIFALSPSDEAVLKALAEIKALFPKERDPKLRLPTRYPNHYAIALWVMFLEERVLLGSDVEASRNPNLGWEAILSGSKVTDSKASLYKVAHHGSGGADNGRIWSDLLMAGPVAVLTPFVNGRVRLPTPSDRDRILKYTQRAYATSTARRRRVPGRPAEVNRFVKSATQSIRIIDPCCGQVRCRKRKGAKWCIELFNDAVELQQARAG